MTSPFQTPASITTRERERKRRAKWLWITLGASIALHGLVWALYLRLPAPPVAAPERLVEIELLKTPEVKPKPIRLAKVPKPPKTAAKPQALEVKKTIVKPKPQPVVEPTKPPVTKPIVTKPPATKPPVTKPPVTKPPVTKPIVTKPPATKLPATKPPATKPPATKPPVTKPENVVVPPPDKTKPPSDMAKTPGRSTAPRPRPQETAPPRLAELPRGFKPSTPDSPAPNRTNNDEKAGTSDNSRSAPRDDKARFRPSLRPTENAPAGANDSPSKGDAPAPSSQPGAASTQPRLARNFDTKDNFNRDRDLGSAPRSNTNDQNSGGAPRGDTETAGGDRAPGKGAAMGRASSRPRFGAGASSGGGAFAYNDASKTDRDTIRSGPGTPGGGGNRLAGGNGASGQGASGDGSFGRGNGNLGLPQGKGSGGQGVGTSRGNGGEVAGAGDAGRSGAGGGKGRGNGPRYAGNPWGSGNGTGGGNGKNGDAGNGNGGPGKIGGTRIARGDGDGSGGDGFGREPGLGNGAGNGKGKGANDEGGKGARSSDTAGSGGAGKNRGGRPGKSRFGNGDKEESLIGRGLYPDGLVGKYYQDVDLSDKNLETQQNHEIDWPVFSTLKLTRVDKTIDFDWGAKPPGDGLTAVFWSARWTGKIFVPKDDTYQFSFEELDDGGRLILDGKTIISVWRVQKSTPTSEEMFLKRGPHDITIEYVQGPATASSLRLAWKSSSFDREIVGAYQSGGSRRVR